MYWSTSEVSASPLSAIALIQAPDLGSTGVPGPIGVFHGDLWSYGRTAAAFDADGRVTSFNHVVDLGLHEKAFAARE